MKKLFSFISVFALAATLGISTVSAQKTVATVEKLWSKTVAEVGATIADTRQGTGVDGKVYLLNKANQSLVAISAEGQDTVCVGPLTVAEGVTANLDATAYALDDAANFVMVGTFPNIPSHIVLRKADGSVVKDLAITGLARTDVINATGDVFSAEGGYVFVYGNGANLLVYTIANGELVGEPTTVAVAGVTGGNYVIAGDDKVQIAHHRSSGSWKTIEAGVATAIDMPGHKATTLGGDIITLAGKEFYMYPAGTTNYSSEFSVRNMTDGAFVADKTDGATIFAPNASATVSSTVLGCYLNASKIDDNNAYIHVYNSQGAAVYQLSVVVAATVTLNVNDAAMGTVEGAGDYAVGGNATVKAIPALGHSFVAWKNGEETVSTAAEYTFEVKEDVALTAVFQTEANKTLTLAVNDATMGSITLPEGIVMGENNVLYGTPVALTAVPAEGATFNGWFNGEALYSSEYTINLTVTADLALTAQFTKSLVLAYDLGGGVTNAYGWLSKAHMCLDFQNDYNTTYNTSKAWAKEENGVVFYYVSGAWKLPAEVEGSAADVAGFLQASTYNTSDNLVKLLQTEKWAALGNYINGLRTAAGNAVADEGAMRADLSGFFLNSPAITDYRHTNDYAIAGQPAAFCPVMKMGFDNPTEVAFEVTLNDPYRAEFTFAGWYAAADFSGEKVTKVSPESVIAGGKLYAKWVEYIPTIKEVKDLAEDAETKVSGVVNYISGKNVYIQDATGGILVYTSENPTCQVGDKIVAKGVKVMYGGAPEVKNAVVESATASSLFDAQPLGNLAELLVDQKYFATRVAVPGLKIVSYDEYNNPTVKDGLGNEAKCYKMVLDPEQNPLGSRLSITAVAGWYNGFQFVGDVAGMVVAKGAVKDKYEYPVRNNETTSYTLTNDWVISAFEDNLGDNMIAEALFARGMAVKEGIMYFIDRTDGSLVVVDGATGDRLDPIKITGEHVFERENVSYKYTVDSALVDGVMTYDTISVEEVRAWGSAVTLPYNDIKFDWAGNCLIGACVSGQNNFQIYTLDLETGVATELINERLYDNPDFKDNGYRFDAFGVAGDVTQTGVVMAACANSLNVYRWLIEDGVVGEAEQIAMLLDPEYDNSLMISQTQFGTAPQIFPQDEVGSLFYVDGFNTVPTLFDEGGILVDDFANCPTGVDIANNEGDAVGIETGVNGLIEFQVGEDYFLLVAARHTSTNHTAQGAFGLFKYADEGRAFTDMEPLWYFPAKGLGGNSNGCRTAVPSVEVDGNQAKIYIYNQNNGYGCYTLTLGEVEDPTALEDVNAETVINKVVKNGQVLIIKNGVKFNVLGAEVK